MKLKGRFEKRVLEKLEIPEETALDTPKLSVWGFEKLVLENYKSIIQYDTEVIRINTSSGIVKITGAEFDIKWITDEMLEIHGEISGVFRE